MKIFGLYIIKAKNVDVEKDLTNKKMNRKKKYRFVDINVKDGKVSLIIENEFVFDIEMSLLNKIDFNDFYNVIEEINDKVIYKLDRR